MSRLAEWVAGGVDGWPGAVDTTAPGDPSTPTPAPSATAERATDSFTKHGPRHSRWITAAAMILVAEGLVGVLYVPALIVGSIGPLPIVAIAVGGLAVLNVAAGIGLLRLRGAARLVAGALSSFALVFMYAPALTATVANGVWLGFDVLGAVGSLVVLFAVLRRWPAEPVGDA